MQTLTLEELTRRIPAIATQSPHPGCSQRYSQIKTIDLLGPIMEMGWLPAGGQQSKTNARAGFQKHVIRLRHESLSQVGDSVPELIICNSHDRTSQFMFLGGVFRFVCSNDLVVGSTFNRIKIMHMNLNVPSIIESCKRAADNLGSIIPNIKEMGDRELAPHEMQDLAQQGLLLKYRDEALAPIHAATLLERRRKEDEGNSLWKVFNVVQENLILGGQRDREPKTDVFGRMFPVSNPIQQMDRQTTLNMKLWDVAASFLN